MPKVIIDGQEVDAEDGMAIIQACEDANVEIPRFCYHERLSVAGNCRMCLVEVVGAPKLVASCAVGVNDLRPGPNGEPPEILTNSEKVQKARQGTMEFLLINHPLDCPICDQGGECDLQDQAMAFGGDTSRYAENKRAVEDRNIGPLIKTIMTRCISCTRCVRYMTEVAGVNELGQIGRGEGAEISTYLDQAIHSEISGNVIDLCPVGALTSRPYAFSARPWETRKTETIDVMDGLGANIVVEARGNEVMRIMPRDNDEVNEEWISDKTRFIWDGLKTQRLDQPYVRQDGKLKAVTWEQAFATLKDTFEKLDPARIGAIAGDLASVEEMFALKKLMQELRSPNYDCRQDGSVLHPQYGNVSYRFNSDLQGIDEADMVLLVGTNPRLESAVLNARLYRNWMENGLEIGLVGRADDLCFQYSHLGDGAQAVVEFLEGKSEFAKKFKQAERPMIIVGEAALNREDGEDLLALCGRIADEFGLLKDDWNGFNVLHTVASRVGGLDIGFVPEEGGMDFKRMMQAADKNELSAVFLLGADELDVNRLTNTFVVYIGSHGDQGAQMADVILPGAAYTEKDGTYVNMAGRVQMTQKACFPPGQARDDWTIIRAMGDYLGADLNFDSFEELQKEVYEAHPDMAAIDQLQPIGDMAKFREFTTKGLKLSSGPLGSSVLDFYLTNPITRASAIMAEMSAKKMEHDRGATGTNG